VNNEDQLVTIKFQFENGLIDSVFETSKLVGKKRIKCIVSYDGSTFDGYQKQPSKNTVQDHIEKAIFKATNEKITIHSSGRTDKGVHANNQVFHFDTSSKISPDNFYQVINSNLVDSIYVKSSKEVHETFHSRYDIVTKEYYYVINKKEYDVIKRNYEWYPGEFDSSIFKSEIMLLEGTHDFTSFTKTNDTSNIRTIYDIKFVENNHYLYIYIKGNGFLRYMIRNIVASAMTIAKNKTVYSMRQLLHKKDNSIIKDIAPSGGLYMHEVIYDE
jgi:tRNA pseudouridine38-40 synthase